MLSLVHMQLYARFAKEAMDNGVMTGLWIGDSLYVVTADPELADILTRTYLEKADIIKCLKFFTKNGSIFAPDKYLRSFLELLIDDKCLSDYEIMEEVLVILVAGIVTTATTAAFTSLLLAQHQDVQDKVFEEIKEVFGDSNRLTEPEDLPSLKYLEAVIKESLRLYPPVPQIVRRADKDLTLPSGITIVEGCSVLISMYGIHRNPKYWGPDVDQFRPERFFEPLKHPAQFTPFSYGSRNCLGYQYSMMSLKTSLSMLLRRFRLLPATPSTNGSKVHKPFRIKYEVMMKDVENFMLQLEERVW